MLETDHLLRGLLGLIAFLCVLGAARFFGAIAPERSRPIHAICLGLFLVLVYVMAGQYKAFLRDIAFDGFSAFGLFAYTVLLSGLAWFHGDERRKRRGR